MMLETTPSASNFVLQRVAGRCLYPCTGGTGKSVRHLEAAAHRVATDREDRLDAAIDCRDRRFCPTICCRVGSHTNTFLNPEGGVAARRLGLPHVWHLRELLGPRQPFRLAGRTTRIARFVRQHASLVVANSKISAVTAGESIPAEMTPRRPQWN